MVQEYEDPEVQNLIDLSAIYNIPMLGTYIHTKINIKKKHNLKNLCHKTQIFFIIET